MTDGILLAETQTDPLLRAYDTLIIDEAHERSLNIDFLLGHLRQILPRRPDLKIIVTSATIDAERFAKHFAQRTGAGDPGVGPPVPGRAALAAFEETPRARPERRDRRRRRRALARRRARRHPGLPARRARDPRCRRSPAQAPRGSQRGGPPAELLPLFARLSQAEQDRVFRAGNGRRIVLATNVAETSLTVPGIRFVIDSGLARVKRYSYRNKVEQLQVEPISQAAANQRAGRCGRVADGICIRLYDENDFASRPRFTDPEILRSSLAGVILRMKSLRLGSVEDFPFLEAPPRKAIADGYALLGELNAVDDDNELTPIGQALSRLPLDPRVGRMILEARDRAALSEVLIIAAALVGAGRARPAARTPAGRRPAAQEVRRRALGVRRLPQAVAVDRRGARRARPAQGKARQTDTHRLSNRQQEQRLRESFVNPRRVREWRDIHSQLHTVVREQGWRENGSPATYEQIHQSMLAGLLGNVGIKSDDEDWYLGARGIKFWRHPGAHLAKKPGRWLVAAELVETTRLFGRGLASIDPAWLPPIAGHLIKTQLLEPHWEKKAAEVIALERATLYGIVIYNNRRVNFGRIDPVAAREIFIREALVNGDWDTTLPFLAHNRKLIRQVEALEHKSRRQDVLVDDELIFAFYDQQLPADVCSGASCERWFRVEVKRQPQLLQLSRDELMRHEAAGITTAAFPKTVRLGGIDCAASYLHEPGDAKDGVTVTVPIYALNQVDEERCEWLVPGMLKDKVLALVKSLHQRPRSRLVPLPDFAAAFCELTTFAQGALIDVLLAAVRERTQLAVQRNDFKLETVSPHLFMNFRIVDEHGRQLATGRHLAALKAEWGGQARSAFQALAALKLPQTAPRRACRACRACRAPAEASTAQIVKAPAPRHRRWTSAAYTDWTFGELPELLEVRKGAQTLIGFPALIDKADHVEIEVFDEPEVAAARHRAGLRRLVALQIREPLKYVEKNIPDLLKMAVGLHAAGHAGRAARADHRRGAGPRLPRRPAADRCTRLQGPGRGRPRSADADRAGGGATGRRGAESNSPPPRASSRTAGRRRRSPTTLARSCSACAASASSSTRPGRRCSTVRAT